MQRAYRVNRLFLLFLPRGIILVVQPGLFGKLAGFFKLILQQEPADSRHHSGKIRGLGGLCPPGLIKELLGKGQPLIIWIPVHSDSVSAVTGNEPVVRSYGRI